MINRILAATVAALLLAGPAYAVPGHKKPDLTISLAAQGTCFGNCGASDTEAGCFCDESSCLTGDHCPDLGVACPGICDVTPPTTTTTLVNCSLNRDCAPGEVDTLELEAISCTEVFATWDVPEENAGGIRNYGVLQHKPTEEGYIAHTNHPITEVLLEVEPSTDYSFEVAASDFYNNWTHTGWTGISTPACDSPTTTLPEENCVGNYLCAPTQPQNVQAEAISCSEVLVTWDASEPQNGSDLRNYLVIQVRANPDGGEYESTITSVDAPATEAVVDALPETEYYYYINAGDSENNYSPYSGNWPYVTTPTCDPTGDDGIWLHHIYCGVPVRLDGLPDGTKVPLEGCEAHIKNPNLPDDYEE